MSATISKSTPVLFVERIEPSLAFWQALGFEKTMEVPGETGIGFCILTNGQVELMYQTYALLHEDAPQVLDAARGRTFLFVEVPDLAAAHAAVSSSPVYLPRRTTFYGSEEIGVTEPGGHYVTFAQFKRED